MIVMNLEIIPAGVSIAGVLIAIYTDMRRRIIPNKLNYSMIAFGIVFYLLLGTYRWDLITAISGALGATISFAIGYFLWITGGWAGGDVKLFTALGALLFGYKMPVGNPIYPMPLTIIFNGLVIMLPLIFVYALIRRIHGGKVFYETVKITNLKEGMIPAETIYEKNGKVGRLAFRFYLKSKWDKVYTNPNRAAGLTRYQVGALRCLVRSGKLDDTIKIKKGLPFAPALGAGVLIAVFFGDIYWQLLLWLLRGYP